MVERTGSGWGMGGILLAIILDQWTKWWFVAHQTQSWEVIPGFLSFDFVQNLGLAFGVSANKWVIVGISVILLLGLGWFMRSELLSGHYLTACAAALMAVGAVSNLVDRLRYGFVVDWIDVHHWSVFNLADTWITVGAAMIVIQYWMYERKKKSI